MRLFVSLWLSVLGGLLCGQAGWAQSIVGQDATIVNSTGNSSTITGGTLSGNNLFHSFTQFGLNANQTATFQLSNPQIANIFARVTGGNPSVLDGNLAIGGTPNFYLMNPAGVIFGPNFQFPTGLPLTATTANGLVFGSQWWSATGINNYATLTGNPTGFGFTTAEPAAIINRWASGDAALTLIGGTVISPVDTNLAAGNLTIAAVPGNRLVRITSSDSLLGLEIRPFAVGESQPNAVGNPVPSLAQLITGPAPDGRTIGDATGLQLNPNGTVSLNGASLNVGDVYAGNLTANGVLIGAPNGNVTVSTIEVSQFGLQVTAGKHFQATGSRAYIDRIDRVTSQSVNASIAVNLPSSQAYPLSQNLSITYDGGSVLTRSTTSTGLAVTGAAPFGAGGTTTPGSIPSNASGTANTIMTRSSLRPGGLTIAYANQTFGEIGPVPGTALRTTMGNQPLTAESPTVQTAESVIGAPGAPPTVSDRTQTNRHCASVTTAPNSGTIVAMRSSTNTTASGSCAANGDDAAILKILE
jgi:filamentous hemagglutinin family protein